MRVFRERLSILCVCPSFHFGFDGGMWDLIVLIPDYCLSVYFVYISQNNLSPIHVSRFPIYSKLKINVKSNYFLGNKREECLVYKQFLLVHLS